MQEFAILIALFGIVTTVFWLVIGWRAMRAHERIADIASLHVQEFKKSHTGSSQNEDAKQRQLFNQFLSEVSPDKSLSFQDRRELFKAWKLDKMDT